MEILSTAVALLQQRALYLTIAQKDLIEFQRDIMESSNSDHLHIVSNKTDKILQHLTESNLTASEKFEPIHRLLKKGHFAISEAEKQAESTKILFGDNESKYYEIAGQAWRKIREYRQDFAQQNQQTTTTNSDTPEPWGLFFQDNATPQMEGLEELHNNIMYYLCIILFAVTWVMVSIILNYRNNKNKISNKYVNHGTLVELIWTITPALILILIAFPSFKLLYLMDEVIDPSLVIHGEGHQWYWSYQYPDFVNNDEEFLEYDSYIIPESDLEIGKLRMLEVDNRVVIPELTHTRFIVAGADVIHSYACPSLGIKCDAYPGRLNQSSVYLNREGSYFGQCSEICGILHSSMPIGIQSVILPKFLFWLHEEL